MQTVALAFPTGSDPRSPYLALPYLSAALRGDGVRVLLDDLDIGGIRALLRPSHLEDSARALRRHSEHLLTSSSNRRLVAVGEQLPSTIESHLAVFDDEARFFNPLELAAAREAILDALDVCSAALDPRVRYSISPVQYEVDGVDVTSLSSLIEATKDDGFNLFATFWETDFFPRLLREAPLFLGITLTNRQQLLPGLLLARRARAKGIRVVLGGALLSKFVDRLSRLPEFFAHFADAVVAYEGDTAIAALTDAMTRDADWHDVPNLMYLQDGRVRVNRTHVEDVDRLPTPDFDGLPLDAYLSPQRVLPILMGKGCYYNRCKFCDIPFINHISRKAYRMRSIERIRLDLDTLHRRFASRHFEFTDEALSPTALVQLSHTLLPNAPKRFRFVGYARLEPAFTQDICNKLATMGVRKLFFGLESASQETLTHMDKGIRLVDVKHVLAHCRDAGIRVHLFSIIGFPEETEARARETIRFFADHVPLLDHPGNSFDMHEFGLELRTAYAEQANLLGIQIGPAVTAGEFVIGAGRDWVNAHGLSHDQVDALLEEGAATLRQLFRQWHAAPQPLWPGYEEYALLYADHFADKGFPYRSSLPADTVLSNYRLSWRHGCAVEMRDDNCFIISREGEVGMDLTTFDRLKTMERLTVATLLDDLAGATPASERADARQAMRAIFDQWIAQGLVQLVPELPLRVS